MSEAGWIEIEGRLHPWLHMLVMLTFYGMWGTIALLPWIVILNSR